MQGCASICQLIHGHLYEEFIVFGHEGVAPINIASIAAPKQIKNSCSRDTELRTTLFVFSLDMSVAKTHTYILLGGLKTSKHIRVFRTAKIKRIIYIRVFVSGAVLFARKH